MVPLKLARKGPKGLTSGGKQPVWTLFWTPHSLKVEKDIAQSCVGPAGTAAGGVLGRGLHAKPGSKRSMGSRLFLIVLVVPSISVVLSHPRFGLFGLQFLFE